jgi:hypothetical protein
LQLNNFSRASGVEQNLRGPQGSWRPQVLGRFLEPGVMKNGREQSERDGKSDRNVEKLEVKNNIKPDDLI